MTDDAITEGAFRPEDERYERMGERDASTRRALLIYVTNSALYGLSDDGAEVVRGASEDTLLRLRDHIVAQAQGAENCAVVLEFNAAPRLRDRLLREVRGTRHVLDDTTRYWRTIEAPLLSGLAGFVSWAREEVGAKRGVMT